MCETCAHKIVVADLEDTDETFENLADFKKRVLRHELVHAFLAESGLRSDSEWAEEEEMVDWIAIQFPKMMKVFQELGIDK